MSDTAAEVTAEQLARGWFDHSPFINELGMRLIELAHERARVELPFKPSLATAGDIVHGGAISTLADTAAVLAAWSGHDIANGTRWGTIGMSLNMMSSARGTSLFADARTTKRGKAVCFSRVDIYDPDDRPIAEALVTYRLG
jgi:uncharacterized protein (TIGR00369 family)